MYKFIIYCTNHWLFIHLFVCSFVLCLLDCNVVCSSSVAMWSHQTPLPGSTGLVTSQTPLRRWEFAALKCQKPRSPGHILTSTSTQTPCQRGPGNSQVFGSTTHLTSSLPESSKVRGRDSPMWPHKRLIFTLSKYEEGSFLTNCGKK